MHDHRFARSAGRVLDLARDRRCGRLGDQHDHARGRVGGQRGQPLQHRDAADLFLQIAAAGAQRLRDAAAQVVDAAGDLLQPGARCGDETDVAAPHDVGEAERHAVDDRGAAIGAHHQQVLGARHRLDRALFVDRHVVGEQHHVQAERERLHRLGGGVVAGHRDQREVGVRRTLDSQCQARQRQ